MELASDDKSVDACQTWIQYASLSPLDIFTVYECIFFKINLAYSEQQTLLLQHHVLNIVFSFLSCVLWLLGSEFNFDLFFLFFFFKSDKIV